MYQVIVKKCNGENIKVLSFKSKTIARISYILEVTNPKNGYYSVKMKNTVENKYNS